MGQRYHFIVGVILFFVLYFEPIEIAAIKFSHLWKMGAIFLLLLIFIQNSTHNRRAGINVSTPYTRTLFAGYLLCAWTFLAGFFHVEIQSAIILCAQRLFPLLLLHYTIIRGFSRQQLGSILIFSVIFTAMSTVPFHLGILEPLGKGYDVVALIGAEQSGFVGIFQNQHAASLSFSFTAILAVFYIFKGSTYWQKILAGTLMIILCYSMVLTYARAGYAAFILAAIAYVVLSGRIAIAFRMVILIVGVFAIIYSFIPDTNIFQERLLGRTRFSTSSAIDINAASSGRLIIWNTALAIYGDSGPPSWFKGIGEYSLEEKMGQRINLKIFAHNGYINELVVNGAIGFALYIYFLYAVFRDIQVIQDETLRHVGLSLFAAMLTFIFFVGGEYPLQYMIVFLFVAIGVSERQFGKQPDLQGNVHEKLAHS